MSLQKTMLLVYVFVIWFVATPAVFAVTYTNTYDSSGHITSSYKTTQSTYVGKDSSGNAMFIDSGNSTNPTDPNIHFRTVTSGSDSSSHSSAPTDHKPLGDIQATLGDNYAGPNTSCDAVQGWTCDKDSLESPMSVSIYVDGSTTAYTSFKTNIPNTGLVSQCGTSKTSMWGFKWPTPNALKDGKSHTLKVKSKNIGSAGTAYDVYLPNTSYSQTRSIPLKCTLAKIDLSATLSLMSEQYGGVPFTVSSTTIANRGTTAITDDIPVILQFDKQTSADAAGWKWEGNGNNGDVQVNTTVDKDLDPDATARVTFSNIVLPNGTYRVRAVVDSAHKIENASSTYLANNYSQWQYFNVVEPPPALGKVIGMNTANCVLNGWAYDPASSSQSVKVNIFKAASPHNSTTLIDTCLANATSTDTTLPPGKHNFACQMDDVYRDGKSHTYYLNVIDIDGNGPNNALTNSPKTATCTLPPPQLIICPASVTTLDKGETVSLKARYWKSLSATPNCSTTGYTDVTASASWSSSNVNVATVGAGAGIKGVVTGVNWGSTNVTAVYSGLTSKASIGVSPTPPKISIDAKTNTVRYDTTATTTVTIDADYGLACTIKGLHQATTKFNHGGNPRNKTYTFTTDPLVVRQTITVDCVGTQFPDMTGHAEFIIGVIPLVQEI
jgi:hypothetical protein